MLRVRIIVWGISLFLFASWLFSEEIEPSDLVGAIKSIETTLHQLQKEINDLHGSVKELSQAGKKKQNRPPGDRLSVRTNRMPSPPGSWRMTPTSMGGARRISRNTIRPSRLTRERSSSIRRTTRPFCTADTATTIWATMRARSRTSISRWRCSRTTRELTRNEPQRYPPAAKPRRQFSMRMRPSSVMAGIHPIFCCAPT